MDRYEEEEISIETEISSLCWGYDEGRIAFCVTASTKVALTSLQISWSDDHRHEKLTVTKSG